MKTEEEVIERLNGLKNMENINFLGFRSKIAYEELVLVLEWMLKPSEPKRTIYDLTSKELEELVLIAIDETEFTKPIESNIKAYIDNTVFTVMTEPDNASGDIELTISNNLDFDLIIGNTTSMILNQAKLRNRLNEMLSRVE